MSQLIARVRIRVWSVAWPCKRARLSARVIIASRLWQATWATCLRAKIILLRCSKKKFKERISWSLSCLKDKRCLSKNCPKLKQFSCLRMMILSRLQELRSRKICKKMLTSTKHNKLLIHSRMEQTQHRLKDQLHYHLATQKRLMTLKVLVK